MSQHLAVAGGTEKLLAGGTKTVRMVSVLLVACDPCGYMRNGGSAHDYTSLARQVEGALHAGMGASQVKALLQNTGAVDDTARFCEAAVDWWRRSIRPHVAVVDNVHPPVVRSRDICLFPPAPHQAREIRTRRSLSSRNG